MKINYVRIVWDLSVNNTSFILRCPGTRYSKKLKLTKMFSSKSSFSAKDFELDSGARRQQVKEERSDGGVSPIRHFKVYEAEGIHRSRERLLTETD